MVLSSRAAHFAAEIAAHDWSDAPWRVDRAGHRRDADSKAPNTVLDDKETDRVRTNVMWVTAQVFAHEDPTFDVHEYAAACGVSPSMRLRSDGSPSGGITAGLRTLNTSPTRYAMPGSSVMPSLEVEMAAFGVDAAICGDVRVHEGVPPFDTLRPALVPRAHVLAVCNGMLYGSGYIAGVEIRGPWLVVIWDSFTAAKPPRPIAQHPFRPRFVLERPRY